MKLQGFTAFSTIWLGQLLSLTGSEITRFALGIWAYQTTGQATTLALIYFFGFVPVLLSPLAGVLVDRWSRKTAMLLADTGAALVTLALLLLYLSGHLQIWHLYITSALFGTFNSLHAVAYGAAISTLLPKEKYVRANGMVMLGEFIPLLASPILAATLIAAVGLRGVLTLDLLSFGLAFGSLLLVHIPRPSESAEGRAAKGSAWQQMAFGFRYIAGRPSLLGLLMMFSLANFAIALGATVESAYILARTDKNAQTLALVNTAIGLGGVLGGLLVSVWTVKRKIVGLMLPIVLEGFLGGALMGIGRSLPVWLIGAFFLGLFASLPNPYSMAIWQAKVPPDVQGRVFSVRRTFGSVATPLAVLLSGPLADKVFEPAMKEGGAWANHFGWLVGTGTGAGMGLMLVLSGWLMSLVALLAWAVPAIRNVEDILPDHDGIE